MTILETQLQLKPGDVLVHDSDPTIRYIWLSENRAILVTASTTPESTVSCAVPTAERIIESLHWAVYRDGNSVKFQRTKLEAGDCIIAKSDRFLYVVGGDGTWLAMFDDNRRIAKQQSSYSFIEDWGVPCTVWRNGEVLVTI